MRILNNESTNTHIHTVNSFLTPCTICPIMISTIIIDINYWSGDHMLRMNGKKKSIKIGMAIVRKKKKGKVLIFVDARSKNGHEKEA